MSRFLSPFSSMSSSPRSPAMTSLPIVESRGRDDDISDTIDDYNENENYENENENYENDNENYENDNENYENENENESNENYENEPMDSSSLMVPLAASAMTTVSIVHLPQKGLTAWLGHMQRKERRSSIFEKLRSLVF